MQHSNFLLITTGSMECETGDLVWLNEDKRFLLVKKLRKVISEVSNRGDNKD